jgi:ribonuclease HI
MAIKSKKKFYVVWVGAKPGIYQTWDECQKQVIGFKDSKYKSYPTKIEAEKAFLEPFQKNIYQAKNTETARKTTASYPKGEYLCVDAAWNTVSGDAEYRGVMMPRKQEVFQKGPYLDGTNNIVEFLGIVHGLAWCKQNNYLFPIYSDSKTAISWIKKKKANTKLEQTSRNKPLFELLERAENWIKNNTWTNEILKWETDVWGEIPADFGRK